MENRPRKTVRFSFTAPRTPSPASSTASDSLSSSPGPSTPQAFPIHLSPRVVRPSEYPSWQPAAPASQRPYNYPAFSSASADETMVDPLLEVLKAPALPPLLWDVMTHPNNIKLGSAYSQSAHYLLQSHLARCAARTSMKNSRLPLAKMVLIVPGHPLEVEVTPAAEPLWSDMPLPFVTVGDVLYGIYRALRESVNATEFDRLPRAQREAMRVAFERRLRSDPANYARNLQTGVRRVDYLGENRRFIGIRLALGTELPPRRRREETFVVELGRVL